MAPGFLKFLAFGNPEATVVPIEDDAVNTKDIGSDGSAPGDRMPK